MLLTVCINRYMNSVWLILPESKSVKYEVFLVMSLWHLRVYQVIVIVNVAASVQVMSHERFIDEISVNFLIFFSHLTFNIDILQN